MKNPEADFSQYDIKASSRRASYGIVPVLKVIRLCDRKVIFPFPGCEEMPICADVPAARAFALERGRQLALGDIRFPEI